jgi:hypothetical protein
MMIAAFDPLPGSFGSFLWQEVGGFGDLLSAQLNVTLDPDTFLFPSGADRLTTCWSASFTTDGTPNDLYFEGTQWNNYTTVNTGTSVTISSEGSLKGNITVRAASQPSP